MIFGNNENGNPPYVIPINFVSCMISFFFLTNTSFADELGIILSNKSRFGNLEELTLLFKDCVKIQCVSDGYTYAKDMGNSHDKVGNKLSDQHCIQDANPVGPPPPPSCCLGFDGRLA